MEKLDIHQVQAGYNKALQTLEADQRMCPENKKLILSYLRDCQLGKTILNRQAKRIREKRLFKILCTMKTLNWFLGNKDFREISQVEMEDMISRLDANRIVKANGRKYSDWTRHDFKINLRKFYKWLLGNGTAYPSIVSWIDTSITPPPPPALSLDEVRRCADLAPTIRGRAIIWTLFESGARAEEFLNIRIAHVQERGNHYLAQIEFPKTFKRMLPIIEGARYLREWLRVHPDKDNREAPLFPMSYDAVRVFLKRIGQRAIGRPIRPHLLRDAFATWLAGKRVGRYQMCKLMGWALSSDMPDRYIDRTGLVEEDAIHAIRKDDLGRVEQENEQLRMTLTRLEAQSNALQERLAKREHADSVLARLLDDEDFKKLLVQKTRGNRLKDDLLSL